MLWVRVLLLGNRRRLSFRRLLFLIDKILMIFVVLSLFVFFLGTGCSKRIGHIIVLVFLLDFFLFLGFLLRSLRWNLRGWRSKRRGSQWWRSYLWSAQVWPSSRGSSHCRRSDHGFWWRESGLLGLALLLNCLIFLFTSISLGLNLLLI